MKLITDTLEKDPLEFVETEGVEIVRQRLDVGDYTAEFSNGKRSQTVIERKSIADLFGSFSSGYEAERNKIIRAKSRDLKYILAIEGSASEIRKGHAYVKSGQINESRKTGISQVRQLCTIRHKYGVELFFCESRKDMAFLIVELFLAEERALI